MYFHSHLDSCCETFPTWSQEPTHYSWPAADPLRVRPLSGNTNVEIALPGETPLFMTSFPWARKGQWCPRANYSNRKLLRTVSLKKYKIMALSHPGFCETTQKKKKKRSFIPFLQNCPQDKAISKSLFSFWSDEWLEELNGIPSKKEIAILF